MLKNVTYINIYILTLYDKCIYIYTFTAYYGNVCLIVIVVYSYKHFNRRVRPQST